MRKLNSNKKIPNSNFTIGIWNFFLDISILNFFIGNL